MTSALLTGVHLVVYSVSLGPLPLRPSSDVLDKGLYLLERAKIRIFIQLRFQASREGKRGGICKVSENLGDGKEAVD